MSMNIGEKLALATLACLFGACSGANATDDSSGLPAEIRNNPRYHTLSGYLVLDDMVLGPLSQFETTGNRAEAGGGSLPTPSSTLRPQSASIADLSSNRFSANEPDGTLVWAWPNATVTLCMAYGADQTVPAIPAPLQQAITTWNANTSIKFVWAPASYNPWSPPTVEPSLCGGGAGVLVYPGQDWLGGTDCAATVGARVTPHLWLGSCNPNDPATYLHELGHVIGLVHEQSRTDRGNYVTIGSPCGSHPADCAIDTSSVPLSEYDYGSIMEYSSPAVIIGGPQFPISIPPPTKLSAYDVSGVGALYAAETEKTTTVATRPGTGYDVYVRGTDGMIWQGVQTSTGFGGWNSLGGPNGAPTLGMPAASVAPNREELVVRGRDAGTGYAGYPGPGPCYGCMYRNTLSDSWSGWTQVSGIASSDPSVIATGASRVDYFFRGMDPWGEGHLWHGWNPTGAYPYFTEDLGGMIIGTPQVLLRGTTILVVAVGADHGLWIKSYDMPSGAWSPSQKGWLPFGGDVLGTPKIMAIDSNSFDVFAEGRNRHLLHIGWTSATGWSTWEDLGGSMNGNPEGTSWSSTRLDVLYHSSDGGVRHKWRDAFGWHPSSTTDESLGSSIVGTPAAAALSGTFSIFTRRAANGHPMAIKSLTGSTWSPCMGCNWTGLGGNTQW